MCARIFGTALLLFLLFHPGFVPVASAFTIPERLEFELSYTGITAGYAVQEVKRDGEEVHIVSTARSANWLRLFFPVDDRIESSLTAGSALSLGIPRLYRERKHEGKTITDREARFDFEKNQVVMIDHGNHEETHHTIHPHTYDTLSGFFHLRTLPLQVGSSYFIDIYDCNRLWNTEVKVLRHEEITIPLGRFKTVVVQPLLKSEGLFAQKGDIFIWLTDDEQHIPVQMKSKVVVGSITATLISGSHWPDKKQ